jgi:phosphoribosylanthranilate isomerase
MKNRRFGIAGGLNLQNITTAAATGAYLVDISSGIEAGPGLKDPLLMAAVMEKIIQYRRAGK